MTKTEQDATIHAGNAVEFPVQITTNGSPEDVSDAEVEYVASAHGYHGDPVIEKSLGDGVEIIDGANGEIQVNLDPEDTEDLGGRVLFHQIHATDAGGDPATTTEGELIIKYTNTTFSN